ncbi:MAG TPA: branched-chain amino acid ABC transporter permease [Gaiellales bacterium]|nr:branched-chain amino acid ABC transporter permease [Gaiellales bacterium]
MTVSIAFYATQAVHGLVYGMLLFLVASGLTLVFGMLRVLNIAHAAFYTLGAYFAYSVVAITHSFWLALIVVPVAMGLIGAAVERFLLRPMGGEQHTLELMLTFGLFYIVGEVVLWYWGSVALQVPMPVVLSGSVPLFGAKYPIYRIFILGVSSLVCVVMGLVLMTTRVGTIIRATVSDGEMVSALGIDVSLVRLGVFGAGTGLAALAGVIAAPFLQADPSMGSVILIDAFAVVVIGGFGSLFGALVAALLIGEVQAFGILFVPELAMVFEFLLMAAVFVVRPQGLFGEAS